MLFASTVDEAGWVGPAVEGWAWVIGPRACRVSVRGDVRGGCSFGEAGMSGDFVDTSDASVLFGGIGRWRSVDGAL